MVKMLSWNRTEMLVADDRVEEYKAAGCVLAAEPSEKPIVESKAEPKAEEKKTVKKATKKK